MNFGKELLPKVSIYKNTIQTVKNFTFTCLICIFNKGKLTALTNNISKIFYEMVFLLVSEINFMLLNISVIEKAFAK